MNDQADLPGPSPTAGDAGLTWAAAAAVAALGAWLLFDALPGINWVLWTAAAVAGLNLLARRRGLAPASVRALGILPVAIAGGAAVTSSPDLAALIALSVATLLANLMLLATGASLGALTARFAVTAPVIAAWTALIQTGRHAIDATNSIRSPRARARVRGLAITLPVLIAFALLLAQADPTMAGWRDAIYRLLDNWDFLARIAFFFVLLVVVLGAYGHAATGAPSAATDPGEPAPWLGSTERLMLLGSVAALFWLFLALQLGYFFGNLPHVPDSGMTFAEYARRGFGELTVVATASALIIVASERYGSDDARAATLQALTFAIIAAVLLLLVSAFRRVLLYEAAYGFTTARLYAQVYMGAVAAGLVLLTAEVAGAFDAGRVFRRVGAVAALLFIGLLYWNHEGWIAGRNIERYAGTGKLDVSYLTTLSPGAWPAIAQALPTLPDSLQSELRLAVQKRCAKGDICRPRHWAEWNLANSRGQRALDAIIPPP